MSRAEMIEELCGMIRTFDALTLRAVYRVFASYWDETHKSRGWQQLSIRGKYYEGKNRTVGEHSL